MLPRPSITSNDPFQTGMVSIVSGVVVTGFLVPTSPVEASAGGVGSVVR